MVCRQRLQGHRLEVRAGPACVEHSSLACTMRRVTCCELSRQTPLRVTCQCSPTRTLLSAHHAFRRLSTVARAHTRLPVATRRAPAMATPEPHCSCPVLAGSHNTAARTRHFKKFITSRRQCHWRGGSNRLRHRATQWAWFATTAACHTVATSAHWLRCWARRGACNTWYW